MSPSSLTRTFLSVKPSVTSTFVGPSNSYVGCLDCDRTHGRACVWSISSCDSRRCPPARRDWGDSQPEESYKSNEPMRSSNHGSTTPLELIARWIFTLQQRLIDGIGKPLRSRVWRNLNIFDLFWNFEFKISFKRTAGRTIPTNYSSGRFFGDYVFWHGTTVISSRLNVNHRYYPNVYY